MLMSAEDEAAAYTYHCGECGAAPGESCSHLSSHRLKFLEHPHWERLTRRLAERAPELPPDEPGWTIGDEAARRRDPQGASRRNTNAHQPDSVWDSAEAARRQHEEFEREHPGVVIARAGDDYDLAREWGCGTYSLWAAREDGKVVAAGDGLAGLMDSLRQAFGPGEAELARDREARRAALLREEARLLAQLSETDAALARLAEEERHAHSAWEADQAARRAVRVRQVAVREQRRAEAAEQRAAAQAEHERAWAAVRPGLEITAGHRVAGPPWTVTTALTVAERFANGTVRAQDAEGAEWFLALHGAGTWLYVCGCPRVAGGLPCRNSDPHERGARCTRHQKTTVTAGGGEHDG